MTQPPADPAGLRSRAFAQGWLGPLEQALPDPLSAVLLAESASWLELGRSIDYFDASVLDPPAALPETVDGREDLERFFASRALRIEGLELMTFARSLSEAQDDLTATRREFLELVFFSPSEVWEKRLEEVRWLATHYVAGAIVAPRLEHVRWCLQGSTSHIGEGLYLPADWRSNALELIPGARVRERLEALAPARATLAAAVGWSGAAEPRLLRAPPLPYATALGTGVPLRPAGAYPAPLSRPQVEFAPGEAVTESLIIHVLWLTSGLGCDGESVAMTGATNPSLEDILTGVIPGMPGVVLHNPLLAYEQGSEFMQAFHDAAAGRLDPFLLVLEGSVPNETINGDGHWSGLGVNPTTGQPITTNEWLDRLAPRAAAVMAVGTCASYGGIPAMRNNPTGAMGLADYLGWDWRSRSGLPIVNVPGCPTQGDNLTQMLMSMLQMVAGIAPAPELDEQLRPRHLFGRTAHESCDRAAFYEQGQLATGPGGEVHHRCLVKLGCSGTVAHCNVPMRGWINGIGGCPNVGGICIGCTMPGFPDRSMPFMRESFGARAARVAPRMAYGRALRYLRAKAIERVYDREPEWRSPGAELRSGYRPRWEYATREEPERAALPL